MATYSSFGADPDALANYRSTNPSNILPFGSFNPRTSGSTMPQSNVRDALDSITARYQNELASSSAGGSDQRFERLRPPEQAAADEPPATNILDLLYADYQNLLSRPEAWETVGGPNAALIQNLRAQRGDLQSRYETNKANASNLYGTLSMDDVSESTGLMAEIQQMNADLDAAFEAKMTRSEERAGARQAALQSTLDEQQAKRERAAASLGIAKESALTDYSADAGLTKGMADVAGRATDYEQYLTDRQLAAAAGGNRMLTATGNTKIQMLSALQQVFDTQAAEIDAAINLERSKSPTRQLSDVGKALSEIGLDSYRSALSPEEQPLYSENPVIAKKQQGFEYFGKSMGNPNDVQWFEDTYATIVSKINNAKAGVSPGLTKGEKEFQIIFGITGTGLGIVDPKLLIN